MRKATVDPRELLPLKPRVLLMLLALSERGPTHGYALKDEVLERTDGRLDMGPGTLYRTVRGMLNDSLTEECTTPRDEPADERRRYYRITDFGRRVLTAEIERLAEIVARGRAQRVARRSRGV